MDKKPKRALPISIPALAMFICTIGVERKKTPAANAIHAGNAKRLPKE
jgi:hypothetical protein